MPGSLVVVGVGIQTPRHVSMEAREEIEQATKVFFLVADPVSEAWIRGRNSSAESLVDEYRTGEIRSGAYGRMTQRILGPVRLGERVCAAFYGHPGVFVAPSHEALRLARAEGYPARMLPAISAEDCLFADLDIDPGARGCQSFEATDFLVYRRGFDPHSPLILWQVGVLGVLRYDPTQAESRGPGIALLVERLSEAYGSDHEGILYEASPYVIASPSIERCRIRGLPNARISALSTLVLPPLSSEPSTEVLERLGIHP